MDAGSAGSSKDDERGLVAYRKRAMIDVPGLIAVLDAKGRGFASPPKAVRAFRIAAGAVALLCAAATMIPGDLPAGTAGTASARHAAAKGGVGAHVLLGQLDDNGSSPATTPPVTTQATGSSFVMFETGRSNDPAPPTDSYSNTFRQQGVASGYDGYGTKWTFKVYVAENGAGGSGHTITKLKPNDAIGELVIGLIEVTDAPALTDFTQDYAHAPSPNTSRPVHVNGPATLIAIWSGDSGNTHNSATPGNGFSAIESYTDWPIGTSIQTAVARKEVTEAGDYGITWWVSPTQGANLYLLAFEHPQAAASGAPAGEAASAKGGGRARAGSGTR
jgi:hypothetical protein